MAIFPVLVLAQAVPSPDSTWTALLTGTGVAGALLSLFVLGRLHSSAEVAYLRERIAVQDARILAQDAVVIGVLSEVQRSQALTVAGLQEIVSIVRQRP